MTYLLIAIGVAHLIAAALVARHVSRSRRWTPRQQSFAVITAWLIPLFGPLCVFAALVGGSGPGDLHLGHAADLLKTNDRD